MTKRNSLIIAILIIVFNFCASAQSLVVTESFDGAFAPAGWQIKPLFTGFNQLFVQRPNGTNPTCMPHSGAAMARMSSRNFAAGTTQLFVTPVIDYTSRGAQSAMFSLWAYRDSTFTDADSITIYVNTADSLLGATRLGAVARHIGIAVPNTETVEGWYNYMFNVPASYTGATNYIIIQGTSQTSVVPGHSLYLDDFSWDSYPPACAGSPNVGTLVETPRVICVSGDSSQITFSNPIVGVTGLSYQWESASNVAGPFAPIGGNQASYNTGIIFATTYYRCVVTCGNSAMSYTTPVDSVVVTNGVPPVLTFTPNPARFCSGSNGVSITVSGASTYTWTPATGLNTTTGATVLAAPAANTNYTVVGTDAIGCTASVNIPVQLVNSPIVTITAVKDTICQNETLILVGPNAGGGPGGGATYSWSNGVTTRRDTLVNLTTTTSFVLTMTSNFSGCSGTDTFTVTVLSASAPTMTLSPTSAAICDGAGPVTLTATGPSTITWSPATGLDTTGGGTVNANPAFTTVYTVNGSNGGQCSATMQITVGVGNSPIATITNLTMNDTICAGDSVILRGGPNGGGGPGGGFNTFAWDNGVTTRNDTVMPTATTTYNVVVKSAIGCTGTTSYTIEVVQPATANFGYTVNGAVVTFTDSSLNASSLLWNFGDAASASTSTLSNPSFTYPNDSSAYTVTLIAYNNGCGNDTMVKVIDLANVGINSNIKNEKLNFIPNPATDFIYITGINNIANVAVYNTLGQAMPVEVKNNRVNISKLNAGIYSVQVKTKNSIYTNQLIKN